MRTAFVPCCHDRFKTWRPSSISLCEMRTSWGALPGFASSLSGLLEVTFALDQTLDMPQCERKRFLVRVGVSVTEAEELFGLVVHILDGVILVEDDGGVIYQ